MEDFKSNWSDVIELNYDESGLQEYMINAMKFWIEECKVDGFRFDAVDFVPMSFWTKTCSALKAINPGILLIAEGTGIKYHQNGFHMTYGWEFFGFKSGIMRFLKNKM